MDMTASSLSLRAPFIKRFGILSLFLFLSVLAFSQKPGHIFPQGEAGKDYNLTDAKGKRQGPWIRVYGNNPKALLYKGQFKDGQPIGEWEWYYITGELMTKMTHVKGEEITDNISYYETGGLMSEGRFVLKNIDGKQKRCREGLWKLYDRKGTLIAEENYTDSLLNGGCRYYFPSGKLLAIFPYKMGLKDGPFVEYYESGKKMREGTYVVESFDGEFTSWNENGTIDFQGKYVKGVKEGTWHHYNSKGRIEISVLYKNGSETRRKYVNGTFKEYYDSGIPKSEYTYTEGEKDGPFTEWYDIGNFVQVPASKEDMELGITQREKLEGTQVKMQGDYVEGKLEGEVIYYSEKGLVSKVEVYEAGVLKK